MNKPEHYVWLEEDEYNKLKFQLTGQIRAILNPLRIYGLEPYVDSAIGEIVTLAENYGMRVRGKDIPIHVVSSPRPRITE